MLPSVEKKRVFISFINILNDIAENNKEPKNGGDESILKAIDND
jgi:hypothetical protein